MSAAAGRRIQKTQDMDDNVRRDYVFDKEQGFLARHTLETGEVLVREPPPEKPVTIYSEEPEGFHLSNARTSAPSTNMYALSFFEVSCAEQPSVFSSPF